MVLPKHGQRPWRRSFIKARELPILMDADQPLSDLNARWWGGRATGEAFKTAFRLVHNTQPGLASWNNAIQLTQLAAKNSELKGSRTITHAN
jgi:hypothetical protein